MSDARKTKTILDNQKGFTLVEIIAVLVILGILAAVAIPKYFDLQEGAKEKALDAAIAEGVGRVNQLFAKQLLAGSKVSEITYNNTSIGTDLQDFTLTTTDNGTTITLLVEGQVGQLLGETRSRTIPRPGSP
jgi:MSHA pilin protein MshA